MKKLMAVFLGFSIAVLGCTSASTPPKKAPPPPVTPSTPPAPEGDKGPAKTPDTDKDKDKDKDKKGG